MGDVRSTTVGELNGNCACVRVRCRWLMCLYANAAPHGAVREPNMHCLSLPGAVHSLGAGLSHLPLQPVEGRREIERSFVVHATAQSTAVCAGLQVKKPVGALV